MGIPMRALARQNYDGRALKADDEFEAASEEDAADLVTLNFAERRKVPTKSANEAEAGSTESQTATPQAGKTAGQYDRRDMKARRT